jgi:Flagellar basal-body P-ring protein
VERVAPSIAPSNKVHLQLRQADFTTAARIAAAINKQFTGGAPVAKAENAALVTLETPASYAGRAVEFIADVEGLIVDADRVAKIIISERTGTITMGKDVKIAPVSIMQGNLTVQIETSFVVSQPGALSGGETKVVPSSGWR